MKTTLLLTCLLTLAACAVPGTAGRDGSNDFPAVCAEQSAMAEAGLTGGGMQTITCPE